MQGGDGGEYDGDGSTRQLVETGIGDERDVNYGCAGGLTQQLVGGHQIGNKQAANIVAPGAVPGRKRANFIFCSFTRKTSTTQGDEGDKDDDVGGIGGAQDGCGEYGVGSGGGPGERAGDDDGMCGVQGGSGGCGVGSGGGPYDRAGGVQGDGGDGCGVGSGGGPGGPERAAGKKFESKIKGSQTKKATAGCLRLN
jgi:hypothetical protein